MDDILWCAADVAENFGGISIRAAQDMLRRWRETGLVHEVGRDSITRAPLYPATEIREARAADMAELADQRRTHRPSTVEQ